MAASFWAGKNVLVTGAGGFVGSWLARALVDRGAEVTVVLRDQPYRSNFHLLDLSDCLNLVFGSITDYTLVERTVNEYEIDTCFHLAAQPIVGMANRSPLSTFESNVRGTWTVLEVCRLSRSIRRVVVASSDKAYGTQPQLPYTEETPLLGLNPYDTSKACADILARSYRHTFGLAVAVARCANIYGGGDLNFSRLVPGAIRSILRGERPVIRSDGSPVRDYLYIDDAVAGYLALGEQLEQREVLDQRAFNFGANNPINVLELVRRLLAVCGALDLAPDIQGTGKLVDEIDRQYLDSRKAQSMLGWAPRFTLDEGLRRTVDWYRLFLLDGRQRLRPAA